MKFDLYSFIIMIRYLTSNRRIKNSTLLNTIVQCAYAFRPLKFPAPKSVARMTNISRRWNVMFLTI